jgi:predicted DNA-binding protein with PD1-like motif
MKSKLIDERDEKTYAVVFDKGDEVMAGLLTFAQNHGVTAAHLTAIGAFSDATLGYFDRDRKDYRKIPIPEQAEVLALVGDVALNQAKPMIHAHVVVGKADGTAWGGHLLEAHVWPTLEVIVVEAPKHLQRTYDPESKLALIDLDR